MSENSKEDSIEKVKLSTPIEAKIMPLQVGNEIDSILVKLIDSDSSGTVTEPTCPICISPYRNEIEDIYNKDRKTSDVVEFFDNKGTEIHKDIVLNHFDHHLARGIKERQKVEFANKIKRISGQNLTTLDYIAACQSIVLERIMGVNSLVPTSEATDEDIEKTKSAETARMLGQMNNLLKLRAQILGEMKNSGELITIPKSDFINLFNDAFINAKNDGEKALIGKILGKMEELSRSSQ
tara:strand:- start:11416 stop:12129 length:714 start_codon:yes stop_codon:yes gene_type:complete